jgi:hypothetical protein
VGVVVGFLAYLGWMSACWRRAVGARSAGGRRAGVVRALCGRRAGGCAGAVRAGKVRAPWQSAGVRRVAKCGRHYLVIVPTVQVGIRICLWLIWC